MLIYFWAEQFQIELEQHGSWTADRYVKIFLELGIMNPFGRKQETEADYLGLIFSSLSGYDIRESVKVWEENG